MQDLMSLVNEGIIDRWFQNINPTWIKLNKCYYRTSELDNTLHILKAMHPNTFEQRLVLPEEIRKLIPKLG